LWHPKFISQTGSTNTLSTQDILLTKNQNGDFIGVGNSNYYNPAQPYFGGSYTLTAKTGIIYQIDAISGDLDTVTDTNGNILTFSEAGIKSNSGTEIKFARDAMGRIVKVIDPMGNEIEYEYDSKGDLVGVTDREGERTQFEYNSTRAHYLDKILDPLGREGAKITYDENGRLNKTINSAGNSVTINYDPANSLQTSYDSLGNPTTYEYDSRGNVIRAIDAMGGTIVMEYDSNNRVTKTTDANNLVTKYTYDDRGNLTSKSETYCGCPGIVPGTTYYTYNKYGQQTSLTLPTGATVFQDYDSRGNLLAMRDGKGSIILAYTYDANGNVISETSNGSTTTYRTHLGSF
jgi:YD repeat-containing protein